MQITSHAGLLDLSGKVAIVTGGAAGIGFGIAYRLAEAGARVVIAGRRLEEAQKTAQELMDKGWEASGASTDVSKEDEVVELVKDVIDQYGQIDILVNNAGIFPFSPLEKMTSEDFDKVIATNLRGVFLMTKYVSEEMKKRGQGGKIINVTSIDSLHPSAVGLAHYDASKHGVLGFMKNTALELAAHNITVTGVAPGGVLTPGAVAMQSGGQQTTTERFPEYQKMDVPMGRMGVPDDIGKAVLFLASDMSSYMTGVQVVVDGGYLLN